MRVENHTVRTMGDWDAVVDFCRSLADALPDALEDVAGEFEDWRPKPGEPPRAVAARTDDRESMSETRIERESEGTSVEARRAGRRLRDSGSDAARGRVHDTVGDVEAAGAATARSVFPVFIRLLRYVERFLYRHVVGRTSPDFFETPDLTVAIEHRPLRGDSYTVRATIHDPDTRDRVFTAMQQE